MPAVSGRSGTSIVIVWSPERMRCISRYSGLLRMVRPGSGRAKTPTGTHSSMGTSTCMPVLSWTILRAHVHRDAPLTVRQRVDGHALGREAPVRIHLEEVVQEVLQ